MSKRLQTRISQAFWCNPKLEYEFEPAVIPSIMRGDPKFGTCWFDELFEGGIVLPERTREDPRSLTMILSGPPGTGKSTLALELCYRCALFEKRRSLYISLEAHKPWMIENAKSFGWQDVTRLFGAEQPANDQRLFIAPISSEENIDRWLSDLGKVPLTFKDFFEELRNFLGQERRSKGQTRSRAPKIADREVGQTDSLSQRDNFGAGLDFVVIDSLNTIRGDRLDLFNRFTRLASTRGPELIIAILDSSPQNVAAHEWEFIADIVVRLDSIYEAGYLLRTIEVVKARYQAHVWGKHQLKIYEPFQRNKETSRPSTIVRQRAHPYREEGGIFVFPSIHYILSRLKTKSPARWDGVLPSPVRNLTSFLGGGFPKGRCIGLVGGRGTHKSHLGYLQLLHKLVEPPGHAENGDDEIEEKALIVSLRDDEGMTKKALQNILKEQWGKVTSVEDFVKNGKLEISFFPPGFITPEEFFHRLLLSINRLKRDRPRTHVTVLFNSLDQLSSRFPLCAKQQIFVPGIIQMLSAEGITSFFVSATDSQEDQESYGLTSMAELILRHERQEFEKSRYFDLVQRAAFPSQLSTEEWQEHLQEFPDMIGAVVLKVERFAGGQPAGAAGILELVKKDEPKYDMYGTEGLVFAPFAPEHIEHPAVLRVGGGA
jgi:KaiC/GvpD/RAD55 family RecA-like ATPase